MKSIMHFFTPPDCPIKDLEEFAVKISLASGGETDVGDAHFNIVMAGITTQISDRLLDLAYKAIDASLEDRPVDEHTHWKSSFAGLVGREFVPGQVQPEPTAPPKEKTKKDTPPKKKQRTQVVQLRAPKPEEIAPEGHWAIHYIQRIDKPKMGMEPLIMFAKHRPPKDGFTIMTDKKHELVWGHSEMQAALGDEFYIWLYHPLVIAEGEQVWVDADGLFWLIPVAGKKRLVNLPKSILYDGKHPDFWTGKAVVDDTTDDDLVQVVSFG